MPLVSSYEAFYYTICHLTVNNLEKMPSWQIQITSWQNASFTLHSTHHNHHQWHATLWYKSPSQANEEFWLNKGLKLGGTNGACRSCWLHYTRGWCVIVRPYKSILNEQTSHDRIIQEFIYIMKSQDKYAFFLLDLKIS